MRRLLAVSLVCLFVGMVGCEEPPTSVDAPDSSASPAEISDVHGLSSLNAPLHSSASFKVWHQGFNHGTEGWYGMNTPDALGWCGTLTRVTGRRSDPAPSAGRGYVTLAQGDCNAFYAAGLDVPGGPEVWGAPWAPGPAFSSLLNPWPEGGYAVELDIYLDPSYAATAPPSGTYVFEFPAWKGAVFGYSVSFVDLSATPEPATYYLWMPAWEGTGALLVDTHRVSEAGWYTFRFVFRNDGGSLAVDFELADRRGRTLFTKPMASTFYAGAAVSGFDPATLATGYAWFTSISEGLELPIDEYRVRRGR